MNQTHLKEFKNSEFKNLPVDDRRFADKEILQKILMILRR